MVEEKLINWEPLIQSSKHLNWRWRLIAMISIVAIIVEVIYFTCYAIPWAKIGVAECAYWVGAIGSVGAIAAAIWLATDGARQRRLEATHIAHICAAEMANTIVVALRELKMLKEQFKDPEGVDISPDEFEEASTALNNIYIWETNRIALLAPFPNNCALNIAKAQGSINSMKLLFATTFAGDALKSARKQRVHAAKLCKNTFTEAYHFLNLANKQVTIQIQSFTKSEIK